MNISFLYNKIAAPPVSRRVKIIMALKAPGLLSMLPGKGTFIPKIPPIIVGIMAVKAMEQAIVNAGTLADSAYGLASYKEITKE